MKRKMSKELSTKNSYTMKANIKNLPNAESLKKCFNEEGVSPSSLGGRVPECKGSLVNNAKKEDEVK